jgi:hypothetical protein
MSTFLLPAMFMMAEQVVPSAVVQHIIVKFLTNKNMTQSTIL